MFAGRERVRGFHSVLVLRVMRSGIGEYRLTLEQVQRVATEPAALRHDHPLGAAGWNCDRAGDRIRGVLHVGRHAFGDAGGAGEERVHVAAGIVLGPVLRAQPLEITVIEREDLVLGGLAEEQLT